MTRGRNSEQGRGRTIALVIEALRILYGLRLRTVELADALGISYRAAYRLLRTFRTLGLPLRSERKGREVRWWLHRKEAAAWLTSTWMPSLTRGPGRSQKA